jgi:hypothetical protein
MTAVTFHAGTVMRASLTGPAVTSVGGTESARRPLMVPSEQMYYWTNAWQREERRAVAELERGEYVRFDRVEDALAWLDSDAE